MQWLELTIETAHQGLELLEARLTALGLDSFQVDDETEFQSFLELNRPSWDYVDDELLEQMSGKSQVRLYLENNAEAAERIAWLRDELAAFLAAAPDAGLGTLSLTTKSLDEADWENGWKQYYQPIPVGSRLLVVPQWLEPENPEGRLFVRLDPGMMFGTGDHASTRLCLRELEATIHGGEKVLDLGTGSGILSIAALHLGAASILALDLDPKAEDIARENAGYNGFVAPAFTAATANVLDLHLDAMYDVVLANIVADVILPLSTMVGRFLRPGGTFICSGILDTRLPEILTALQAAGMTNLHTRQLDGWAMCRATLAEAAS